MKYLIFPIFLFFFACSDMRHFYTDTQNYYSFGPSETKHIYTLPELLEHSYKPIKPEKVKGISIDLSYEFSDEVFKKLGEFDSVEYVTIVFPYGTIKNDFSPQLSNALSEMQSLRQLYVNIDSAQHLPKLILEDSPLEALWIQANYVEEISYDYFPTNGLKFLMISCSTENLDINWSTLTQLEFLNLHIHGRIQAPKIQELTHLRQLYFFNNEIDSLPDELFNFPAIKSLTLNLPKLKKINNSIGNLETLWLLSIEAYAIDRLPETLCKLKELRDFGISTTDKIGSIAPLTVLPNLERLSIEGINPLLVIEDLIAIEKLKYLYISLAPLYQQDLTPLGQLKKIKQIQFGTRYVEKYDEKFVQKELSDSVKNEIYDQLKLVLPKRFFKI